MQEGRVLPAEQVNRDLLRSILETPKWFWPVVGILGLIVLIAAIIIGYMINRGLGITGLNRPIFWGCLLYTSPSPRDGLLSRMPSSA
mgnify:CR=1 FL=1